MKKLKWLSFACALGLLIPLASCGVKSTETTSNLNDEVYRIYQLAQNSGYEGTYEEWLDSIKGEKGDNIELRVENGYIQWKATGETTWKNLISIEDLKGHDGSSGKDGLTPTITIDEEGYWVINGEASNVKALGETPTIEISEDGYWVLNNEKTETKAIGLDGNSYTIGEDGYWYLNGEKTEYKALGEDGETPEVTIGDNGNWYINGVDTGKQAEGKNGDNGENGSKVTIGEDGYWYIDGEKTEIVATAKDGTSYYVWIKYADTKPSFTTTLYDTPTEDTEYIGIYSGTSSTAPNSYSKYNWCKIKGNDATFPEANVTIELTVPSLLEEYGYSYSSLYHLSTVSVEDGKYFGFYTIPCSTWLDDKFPTVSPIDEDWFDGWYIKGTDKLVDKYTCIGGDVTIEPRWNEDLIQAEYDLSKNFTFSDVDGVFVSGFTGDYADIVLPNYYFKKGVPGISGSKIAKVTNLSGSFISNNDKIKSIYVGEYIESITSFVGGANLTSIVVDENNPYFDSRENCNAIINKSNDVIAICKTTILPNNMNSISITDNIESLTIPNGLDHFYSMSKRIINLYLPSSVKSLYTGATSNLYFDGTLAEWLEIDRKSGSSIYHLYVKNNGVYEEVKGEIVIPSDVTVLHNYALYGLPITKITFEGNITSIGKSALAYLNITEIDIPEGVTTISEGILSGCNYLETVKLPSTLKSCEIDPGWGEKLKNIYYNGSIASWCDIDFANHFSNPLDLASKGSFYIKNGENFEEVVDLVIPDTVTAIKPYAFVGANIQSLTMSNSVTTIGTESFANCCFMKNVTLSDNLTSIGFMAFQCSCQTGCNYTEYNGGLYLGSANNPYMFLFKTVENTTTFTLHKDCRFIRDYAFENATSLQQFNLEKGSCLKELSNAFSYCQSLRSIMISKDITFIKDGYDSHPSLKVVYYQGTEEEWNEITIKRNGAYNRITNATKYFYSEERPDEEGNYWHYDLDGVTPVIWS